MAEGIERRKVGEFGGRVERRSFTLRRPSETRLDPRIREHFHHLAEIIYRRDRIREWFMAEKEKRGVGDLTGVTLSEAAQERPEVERLLLERNRRILGEMLEMVGLAGEVKEAVVEAAERVRERLRHHTVEIGEVKKGVLAELKKSKTPEDTRKLVEIAFRDWFDAKRHFQQVHPQYID